MNQEQQNILATLNLLTLLLRTQKQASLILSPERQHTLEITKEHVEKVGLTAPALINTLEILANKGYLVSTPIFEKKLHDGIREVFIPEKQKEVLEAIGSDKISLINQHLQNSFSNTAQNILPKSIPFDKEDSFDFINVGALFEETRGFLENHSDDLVSIVTVMPFRKSIDRLLEKMNSGIPFNEAQDEDIWYDNENYQLHFRTKVINTDRGNNPSKSHFLLHQLFNQTKGLVIDYSDIDDPDHDNGVKKNKVYYDSIRNLVKKNPELSSLFIIHTDRLEINKEYENNVH